MPLRIVIIKTIAAARLFSVEPSTHTAIAAASADPSRALLDLILSRPASPLAVLRLVETPQAQPDQPIINFEAETESDP